MIGYLTGRIISKKPTQVLLDVNGVGYLLNISINTFDKLTEENSRISLHTYLSVKEDSLTLYGFHTSSEKEMFELLISVNGVGPKSALGILSGISVNEFKNAIANKNISKLVSIPGIGRKTAERMIVELQDKINKVLPDSTVTGSAEYTIKDDAVAALIGLGYNRKAAETTIRKILENNPSRSIEELIKESLKTLNS